jgi:hypothetical protein
MIVRQSVGVLVASVIGGIAGFVTRPCCIGPAMLSLAGIGSAGLVATLATYHRFFASLRSVMLIASLWITFRGDGGWFNKGLAATATILAFVWSTAGLEFF